MINLQQFTIIYGHYGCGKTNFSINLALQAAKEHKQVILADLDIVNPYFRTHDYKEFLAKQGINVIAPRFAGTNLDVPSLPPEIVSVFSNRQNYVIIDVGGDDAGAKALSRFSEKINANPDVAVYYVINKYRNLTQTPQEASELLREIEAASRVRATAIVNNSHLQMYTNEETILQSLDFANETSKLLELPLIATTAPKKLQEQLSDKIKDLYPIDIFVKPPF
ncbi:MAG: ParA family protein [Bacillota bacterium]|nr:ParA family protein [Bacillota bacterium]